MPTDGTLRRNKRYVEIAPACNSLQILERTAATTAIKGRYFTAHFCA
jgi:hypothetical protein